MTGQSRPSGGPTAGDVRQAGATAGRHCLVDVVRTIRSATALAFGARGGTPALPRLASSRSKSRHSRTECRNLLVFDDRHLRAVLAEFADYYNRDRPHRSLRLQSPLSGSARARGRVVSRPVLGGLRHLYARAA
ncbi:MAG: integrase core domain-containing protein [Candidatus Dormibacter sp.]|uniref:integrase core domain-containing protein n=1 Tax=Candidatus Dormibacter sp. TaxID=2973982 RepID=UPI003D9AC0D7